MTQVTVKELAKAVNTPVERLLQQMHEAGLAHTSADQKVSDTEKQTLLTFLEKVPAVKPMALRKLLCSAKPPQRCAPLVAKRSVLKYVKRKLS